MRAVTERMTITIRCPQTTTSGQTATRCFTTFEDGNTTPRANREGAMDL